MPGIMDWAASMSAYRGRAHVPAAWLESPGAAIRRLTPLRNSTRTLAHCNAGGGSRPPHQERTLAFPKEVEHWPLATPGEKLVKIAAKVVSHGRYLTLQLAEVAVPREQFGTIPSLIDDLRPRPAPA